MLCGVFYRQINDTEALSVLMCILSINERVCGFSRKLTEVVHVV